MKAKELSGSTDTRKLVYSLTLHFPACRLICERNYKKENGHKDPLIFFFLGDVHEYFDFNWFFIGQQPLLEDMHSAAGVHNLKGLYWYEFKKKQKNNY